RGNVSAIEALRRSLTREVKGVAGVCAHVFEGARLLSPVLEVGWRDMIARESDPRRLFPNHHEAAGVSVRQGLQQHRIDKAEESRAHPDSESKNHHNQDCDSRTLPECPKTYNQFAPEILNHFGNPGPRVQFRFPFFARPKLRNPW